MKDIDLIPADYYHFQNLRRHVLLFLVLLPVIVFLVGGSKIWLNSLIKSEQSAAAKLKTSEASIRMQREQISELHTEKDTLEKRLALFESMQGGLAAEQMFVVIEKSINDDMWLTDISFMRTNEAGPAQGPKTKNTGYFIVVPKGTASSNDVSWKSSQHMEVQGQTRSFTDLADFIKELMDQPEIVNVEVLQTRRQNIGLLEAVNFSLIIFLREIAEIK